MQSRKASPYLLKENFQLTSRQATGLSTRYHLMWNLMNLKAPLLQPTLYQQSLAWQTVAMLMSRLIQSSKVIIIQLQWLLRHSNRAFLSRQKATTISGSRANSGLQSRSVLNRVMEKEMAAVTETETVMMMETEMRTNYG